MADNKPKNIPVEVISRNQEMQHPEGIQPVEVKQIQEKQKTSPWQKIKDLREKVVSKFNRPKNNSPEFEPNQKPNKFAQLIKERLEKIKDFNRLPVKEKAEIILIAMLALGVVVASSAFVIPSCLTVAGYIGPYLGLSKAAVSIGGITMPNLTTLAGTSGSFGTYGLFNVLGAASFATTTAGMYGVQAGTAAIGTSLLVGSKKLLDKSNKLIKKSMERLPPRLQTVEIKPVINPPQSQTETLQANSNPTVTFLPNNLSENQYPKPPQSQNPTIINTIPENQNLQHQNPVLEIRQPDNVEINKGLNLGDLKARFNNIMNNNELTEEQQNQAVKGMLNSAFLRFKGGAKDIKIDEAIQICLLTNNYNMWQKISKEVGIRNGLRKSEMDLSKERFEKLKKQ